MNNKMINKTKNNKSKDNYCCEGKKSNITGFEIKKEEKGNNIVGTTTSSTPTPMSFESRGGIITDNEYEVKSEI